MKKWKALRENHGPKLTLGVASTVKTVISNGNVQEAKDDDGDVGMGDTSSSIYQVTQSYNVFDANGEPHQSIADCQPGYVTDNPWLATENRE
jgi:hypothetical protein